MKTRNIYKRALILFSSILLVSIIMSTILYKIYVHEYYDASTDAMQILLEEHSTYHVSQMENDTLLFEPMHPTAGFILYPGAKIRAAAYAPLLDQLASYRLTRPNELLKEAATPILQITAFKKARWNHRFLGMSKLRLQQMRF